MAKQTIALKIDVSKIDKKKLFQGKNGAQYLDAVIFLDTETGQYGDNGMVVESVSKEERESGTRGTILGNIKILGGQASSAPSTPPDSGSGAGDHDDLPF